MRTGSPTRKSFSILGVMALLGLLVVLGSGWSALAGESDREFRRHVWVESDGRDEVAFLGVSLAESDGPEDGARVTRVVPGSPADDAGIERGDIIQGIDGRDVRSPFGLTDRVRDRKPGDRVSVDVLRDGRSRSFDVELGERSANRSRHMYFDLDGEDGSWEEFAERMEELGERLGEDLGDAEQWGEFGERMAEMGERLGESGQWEELSEQLSEMFSDEDGHHFNFQFNGPDMQWNFRSRRPMLGIETVDTTPELREHLGGARESGVLVGRVIPGSAAETAGIRVGDLIEELDGESIDDVSDLRRTLRDRAGETFSISVIRDERATDLRVTLEAAEEDE